MHQSPKISFNKKNHSCFPPKATNRKIIGNQIFGIHLKNLLLTSYTFQNNKNIYIHTYILSSYIFHPTKTNKKHKIYKHKNISVGESIKKNFQLEHIFLVKNSPQAISSSIKPLFNLRPSQEYLWSILLCKFKEL